ncbi:tetratricopeptide repeat protein [Streptomyces sp. NPDC006879]|uniref:alpha/beta hydrolase n=1 Tax=Streptomyces sp. NPDC006879 TaxID=3364767 RepID=UPI003682234E
MRVHLVLVHGLFSSGRAWKAFHDLIATDPELRDWVSIHRFEYDSAVTKLRPDRRVAETDDIADQLGTFLQTQLADAERIMLLTHSQGGLIVQRFLARKLWNGAGTELARIKHLTMFACPNTGSGFFLSVRKNLKGLANAQERQLRPFDRSVTEAQRTVLSSVVHARTISDTECPIPVQAFGGSADNIVPPVVARGVFPEGGVVTADHFSIIRPADRTALPYLSVRAALLKVGTPTPRTPSPPRPVPAPTTPVEAPRPAGAGIPREPSPARPSAEESPVGYSPVPPYVRLEEGQLKGQDRHRLIASLLTPQSPDSAQRVHVLAGLGGSGKSRLALEIADRARTTGRKVWWISIPELSARMRALALDLGAPSMQVERAWVHGRAMELVWERLNSCPEPWLLVFDNADEPRRLGSGHEPVSDGTGWLRKPLTENGMVLVTSRVRRQQTWGDWSRVHQVLPLGDEDGASLLLERTGGIGGTNEEARTLSSLLGGLPLALRHAADVIRAVQGSHLTLDSDPQDFRRFGDAVRSGPGLPGPDRANFTELMGQEIVQKVCGIALELLSQRDLPQAATLLKVFACLSIAPVPYRCLLNGEVPAQSPLLPGFSTTQRKAVLEGLEDFGLVDSSERTDTTDQDLAHVLTLHPVVHGILREDEGVRERATDYYGLAVRMLLSAAGRSSPDHPANWPRWGAIAPHALEVCKACLLGEAALTDRSVLTAALELARLTTRFLIATGLLGPADELVLPIIGRCGSFGFDQDDREILGLRHERGRILLEREELTAAEEQLRLVVSARTTILGEDDADTLASRHKLARAINEQTGREDEAEPILRSIITAERTVRGPEHYDTLVVRHTLARTVLALGKDREAESETRQILEISERNHWPPATPEILRVRETLTHCLLKQDEAEEAERVIDKALEDAAQPRDSHLVMRLRYTHALVLLGLAGRTPEAVNELTDLQSDLTRVHESDIPLKQVVKELLEKTRREMPGPGKQILDAVDQNEPTY